MILVAIIGNRSHSLQLVCLMWGFRVCVRLAVRTHIKTTIQIQLLTLKMWFTFIRFAYEQDSGVFHCRFSFK